MKSHLGFNSLHFILALIACGFYPRPVLAFGYCRCLPLSVCVCVRPCVNHELVRVITHHLFQLGSPNLDQRCKRPWLRSLLFCGTIDPKSKFTPFRACPCHKSPPIKDTISKFGTKIHLCTVQIPINFGLDRIWSSIQLLISNPDQTELFMYIIGIL